MKPKNILLNDRKDKAVIIDYGVSKKFKDKKGVTLTLIDIKGMSEPYAPLEQYQYYWLSLKKSKF